MKIFSIKIRLNHWIVYLFFLTILILIFQYLPHGNNISAEKPTITYFDIPNGLKLYDPDYFPIFNTFFIIIYCITAIYSGIYILEQIFKYKLNNISLQIAAGFLTSYVFLCGLNILLGKLFLNKFAAILSIILIATLSASKISLAFKNRNINKIYFSFQNFELYILIISFILFYLLSVQYTNIHVVGDGAIFHINIILNDQFLNQDKYFPYIADRQDELQYFYPLFILLGSLKPNFLDFMIILYPLVKSSVFLILFYIFNMNINNRFMSLIVCIFLFFGPLNINPFEHLLLFDTGFSFFYNLHPGRVLIDLIVFLCLYFPLSKIFEVKITYLNIIYLFIIGLGIATFTASIIIVILPLIFFALIYKIFSKTKFRINYSMIFPVLSGMAFGFLFLGNIFSEKFYKFINIDSKFFIRQKNTDHLFSFFGKSNYCGTFPLEFCQNIFVWAKFFGLPLILFLVALIFGYIFKKINSFKMVYLMFSFFMLFMMFFIYTFSNGNELALELVWTKSRLIEPWFYSVLGSSLCLILSYQNGKIRSYIFGYIMIILIIGNRNFFYNGIFVQLVENIKFLSSQL